LRLIRSFCNRAIWIWRWQCEHGRWSEPGVDPSARNRR
jgi:hypothetical protein